MVSSIKLTQVTTGLALFLASIFFILFTLLISLVPSSTISNSILIWTLVPLFLIFILEASLFWIIQSVAIKEENTQDLREKGFISQGASVIAIFFRYGSIFSSIFLVLFFVLLFGGMIYYFIPLLSKGIILSLQFYIIAGIYLIYFLILRRFVKKLSYRTEKFSRIQLPSLEIEKDGILLNLPFKKGKTATIAFAGVIAGIAAVIFGKLNLQVLMYVSIAVFIISFFIAAFSGKKNVVNYPVKIYFSEIQEIKSLSFVEAQSLQNYKIGPDITLQIQSSIDLVKFLRNPTDQKNRPTAYTLQNYASGTKTILIRGKNLFYLVAVSNENADKLIKDIQKHISHK
jgi:MFS family permease